MKLPIITSYSDFQLRLGLLKLIALVATRMSISKQGLVNELNAILENTVDDSDYDKRLSYYFKWKFGRELTNDNKDKRLSKKLGKEFENTYFSMLLIDPALYIETGFVSDKNIVEIIGLAQSLGLLDKNCSLLEDAIPLRALMSEHTADLVFNGLFEKYNPLILDQHGGCKERTFFLMVLLLHDLPIAYLPSECLKRRPFFHRYTDFPKDPKTNKQLKYTNKSILLEAYISMGSQLERSGLWADIENYNQWQNYFEGKRVSDTDWSLFGDGSPEYRMGKMTSFRHHATPRLEFLADLGILKRAKISDRSTPDEIFTYETTEETERFSEFVNQRSSLLQTLDVENFVRKKMFHLADFIYGLDCSAPSTKEAVLKYFSQGYRLVSRELSNTPIWSVSVMGCLLAQDERQLIEIDDIYRIVEEESHGKYKSLIHYSGGSRFDDEFLISIDQELFKRLGVE